MDIEKKYNIGNVIAIIIFFIIYSISYMLGIFDKIFSISTFEIILLSLAIFRLIRLITYDKIVKFFREYLSNYGNSGIKKTVYELVICPWCMSIRISLFVIIAYYSLGNFALYFILILALSGTASIIQILTNLLGNSAEYIKNKKN